MWPLWTQSHAKTTSCELSMAVNELTSKNFLTIQIRHCFLINQRSNELIAPQIWFLYHAAFSADLYIDNLTMQAEKIQTNYKLILNQPSTKIY